MITKKIKLIHVSTDEVYGDITTVFPVERIGTIALNDLFLGSYLESGSRNIKWGNSIRAENYLDLAEYVGPLVAEHKIGSAVSPYQDGNHNTWIWDGKKLNGEFITQDVEEPFWLPFVYSIQSPVSIMKDSEGNWVCYENEEATDEFVSGKWGIIWIVRNPSIRDDNTTHMSIGMSGTSGSIS